MIIVNYLENIDYVVYNILSNQGKFDKKTEVRVRYGIMLLLSMLLKTALLLLFSIPLGIFKETLMIFIVVSTLKSYAGTVHFKSEILCLLSSALPVYIGAFIYKYNSEQNKIILLILVLTLSVIIYKDAPLKHGKVNKIKESRDRDLKTSLFMCMIMLLAHTLFTGTNLALISLSIVYFTFNKYAIRSADALNKIYKE